MGVALVCAACAESGSRENRVVADSAGVEIIRVLSVPQLDDPEYVWRSELELEIPTQIGLGGTAIVFNPEGILPLAEDTLLVYDASGEDALVIVSVGDRAAARRFGRRGPGPEEISGTRSIWVEVDGSIRVFDPTARKVLIYRRSGELQSVMRAPIPSVSNQLVRDMGVDPVVQSRLASGSSLSKLSEVPGGYEATLLEILPPRIGGSFETRVLWMSLPDGIVWTRSDEAVYHVLDYDGTLIRQIHFPLTARSLSGAEAAVRTRSAADLGIEVPAGPIGLTNGMYAFGDSIFGLYQSEMWKAQEDSAVPEGPRWRLISLSGRYMGTWIPGFDPMWIRGLTAWGVAHDSLGIPVIQKRLLIPPEVLWN